MAPETQSVHHRRDIARHGGDGVVAVLRRIGPAVSPEIERDRAAGRPQVLKLTGPVSGVPRQRMHEHHGQTPSPAIIYRQGPG